MRAIELTCLLLAPIATGFLMTYTSTLTAILAIAAWNLAAWAPECYLLLCAQKASAALRSAGWLTHLHTAHAYSLCTVHHELHTAMVLQAGLLLATEAPVMTPNGLDASFLFIAMILRWWAVMFAED